MARRRSNKEKVEFKPKTDYPTVNAVMVGIFLLQIPWLFLGVVRDTTQGLTLVGCIVAVFFAVKASDAFSEVFGKWLSSGPLGKEPFNDPLKGNVLVKFKAQMWQFFIHVSMAAVEYVVWCQMTDKFGDMFSKPWLTSDFLSDDVPLLETLYLVQIAIWVVTAYYHVYVFEEQSDYFVMLAHHLATIGLVGLSFRYGFQRIGFMVLFVHDVSDLPIDLLKLFNYLKLEDKAGFFMCEGIFTINLISWSYLRLYVFPVKVVYHTAMKLMGTYYVLAAGTSLQDALAQGYLYGQAYVGSWAKEEQLEASRFALDKMHDFVRFLHYGDAKAVATGKPDVISHDIVWYAGHTTIALLTLLFFMHIWWFFLFLRILKGILTDGAHEAGRQEYEGEDKDSPKSSHKKEK